MARTTSTHAPDGSQYVTTGGYTYSNIIAGGSTVVSTGPGLLSLITINTKGASAATLTLYDFAGVSGNKIATVDTTSQVGSLYYDVYFNTGLTVVLSGTSSNVTVAYKNA